MKDRKTDGCEDGGLAQNGQTFIGMKRGRHLLPPQKEKQKKTTTTTTTAESPLSFIHLCPHIIYKGPLFPNDEDEEEEEEGWWR